MRKSEITIGAIVLGVGILLLIGVFFNIDIWGMICPAGLIGFGIWLIYRTKQAPGSGNLKIRFVGETRRRGAWKVEDEETWGFVLDSVLDFSEADLPEGETTIKLGAFVNEIKVKVPSAVGVAIESLAFMTEARLGGPSEQTFFIPYEWQSDNFVTATKKVWIKPVAFYNEIKVEQLETEP